MIRFALPVIEEWAETKELIESVRRRIALGDDVNKEISREICRYAEGLKLRSAPSSTSGIHNVVLDLETGSQLKNDAKNTGIPYHNLASLGVLVTLAVQPVGVNREEQEEISRLVSDIRKQMHTSGWCAGALIDKLQTERAKART
jgi:hypothetical protein